MRRLLFAVLTFLAVPVIAAGEPAERPPLLSTAQRADLDRVSASLNSIHTMTGTFQQIASNGGLSRGHFWVSKPGKMRFEYEGPSQLLVVCDGYTIAVQNRRLKTTDRYPLVDSPLDVVLSDTLHLANSPMIVGVEHQTDSLVIKAHTAKRSTAGDITMVFSDPGLELRQWTILDAQGQQTTVALSNVQTGVEIPASTFVLREQDKFSKNKQD